MQNHTEFPQAYKAGSFHKKVFPSEIVLFTVVDAAAAAGFGDLQLKVKWKFLFILQ